MNPHVHDYTLLAFETLFTNATFVFLVISMLFQVMPFQMAGVFKFFAAYQTLEFLDVIMNGRVLAQFGASKKSLVTLVACMILLSMCQHVYVPHALNAEQPVANATCKLLIVGMHLHVGIEVTQRKKLPSAIRAA
jgi:hypothetical protein